MLNNFLSELSVVCIEMLTGKAEAGCITFLYIFCCILFSSKIQDGYNITSAYIPALLATAVGINIERPAR